MSFGWIGSPWRSRESNSLRRVSRSSSSLNSSITVAKEFVSIVIGYEMTIMPVSMVSAATNFPSGVTGYTSPYPTVVTVASAHHIASGMDWKKIGEPLSFHLLLLGRIHCCSSSSYSASSPRTLR